MTRTRAVAAVLVFFGLAASGGAQPGIPLSGTITSTLSLSSDARLVGDVTCMVAANTPCIRITAPGVTLRLNGFSITGQVDPLLGCSGGFTGPEHGIQVSGQRAVDIRGPGIVERFRGSGIRIDGGSTRVLVRQVTASTNCTSGIFVVGGGDHDFEANTSVRNGSNTLPCGGIWLAGATNGNRLRANRLSGNGYADQGFNFGIGVLSGNDNVIVDNVVMGNTNGIIIFPGVTGNLIRRNFVVGNPPVQVQVDHPGTEGADIRNLAAPDANTLDGNVCVTGVNAECPSVDETRMRLPG